MIVPFNFKIQYQNNSGMIAELSATLFADSVDVARMKLEHRFNQHFPCCRIVHIGEQL